MAHVNTGVLFIMTLPGILLLIYGIILKSSASKFPAYGWGYKTDLTTKNEQAWKEGNNFAGMMAIWIAIANIILWPVTTYIFCDGYETMIIMSCLFYVILSTNILIAVTESHLNKMFDRNGNPKTANL